MRSTILLASFIMADAITANKVDENRTGLTGTDVTWCFIVFFMMDVIEFTMDLIK